MVDEHALQWGILPGATVRTVAVRGQIALAGCFLNKLVTIDLSTPSGPTLLSSLELPDFIKEVGILGDRALVSMTRGSGMAIVDLSNPEDLKLIKLIPLAGHVADMAISADQIYFVNVYRGLGRIDPAEENMSPELLDVLYKPWRIAISDDRLVVASLDNHLFFYNISQGGRIERSGTLKIAGLEKGGLRGIAFSGNHLAVAVADGSIRLFPLSSWPRLKDYFSLQIPGPPYRVIAIPGNDQLAVSLVSAGIALVDVKPSGNSVVSGHLMLPSTTIAMNAQEGMIYASRQDGRQGLVAFTMEEIEQSSFSPATHVDRNYQALYSWNGRLFGYRRDKTLSVLADEGRSGSSTSGPLLTLHDEDGVSIFRMSEAGEVSTAGAIVMEGGALDAVYSGECLHVLHRRGLRIMSGSESGEMSVVAELGISGRPVHMKFLKPGMLLIATKYEGLKVVDVSDHRNPSQISEVSPPEHLQSSSVAQDIFINGQFAYISQGAGGVYIINFAKPERPELTQIVDTPGLARKMVLHENLLLVADGDEGVYMIDASKPGRLLPIGSLPTPLRANEIATVPDGILISNHPGGILKLPLPEKLMNYQVVNSELVQGEVPENGVGGYVYLYDESSQNRVSLEPPRN
jgi:hypothetical protein